jgi:anti-sigma-K factor RskA
VEIDAFPATSKPQARRVQSWIPWTAVAALLVIAAGLGSLLYRARLNLQHETAVASAEADESRHAREVLDVLTSREAQRVVLTAGSPHPVPTARAVYLPSRGALVLQANNLAPIEAGKTYELWIIPANGSAPIPAGLFRPDAAGSASLVLPQIPVGVQAKAFGVTIENAAGSSTPTLPIVLVGAVPSAGE